MEKLREIWINDFISLTDEVMVLGRSNAVVAKYENAMNIIFDLINSGCSPTYMEFYPEKWNGYDKEFLITVEDYQLFVSIVTIAIAAVSVTKMTKKKHAIIAVNRHL